ncbi:MAG: dTDP-4-dehydrorhamnose 3,5-epimerase [Chryseolinea sp.]
MKVIQTQFRGLCILEPKVFEDQRGYFMEAYSAQTLKDVGLEANFVQDNQSFSGANVVRGLHFQNAPYAHSKLIRVLSGTILDIALDLRRDEPTFGKHFAMELSSRDKKQLYIPKGFAHGFRVLEGDTTIFYKCDTYYYPQSEGGILYNDPALSIDWGISDDNVIVSEKDKKNPLLANATFNF